MTMPSDMRAFNRSVVEEFRANGGELKSPPLAGSRLVLLTTVGATSGASRTTPLAYFTDGPDRVVLWASNMAAARHPDWYVNLAANPAVTVEVARTEGGVDRFEGTATAARGAERDRLLAGLAAYNQGMHDHQKMTDREIPLVVVERATA
jgi:deazaflavin-dependent oxidoreductase (nitroreductase family)